MNEGGRQRGRRGGFAERLFEPVDAASIAVFRIMLGAILVWEVWRYFDAGWIREYYIEPQFTFRYYGFEWVRPWPGEWMHAHFAAVGVVAVCAMVGLWYRVTSALLFLGFTYWFLLDQTRYLNHLYLTALLLFLMAVVPAHHAQSIDAWRRPAVRSQLVPKWCLWLLRFQVGIVYVFAGIAKITPDWLRGEPLRRWLHARDDLPIIGPLLRTEGAVWFFGYGGLLFDLFVVPFLLWRRTRPFAFALAVSFHLMNKWLFDIGIFPHVMLAATLLFLSPDWPRRIVPFFRAPRDESRRPGIPAPPRNRGAVIAFLAIYAAVQMVLPLRHFAYPGSVHWTEEGHRFAWHMKLRSKRADARYFVTRTATGETWEAEPADLLDRRQADKFARFPDMVLQFAHYLAEIYRAEGRGEVEVRARVRASLNGRRRELLVDPNVNLAREPRSLRHAEWILPMRQPLRRSR